MDARRTETTCVTPAFVAPRHVDAPRDLFIFYFIFLRTSNARGGGRGAARLFFFFSPVQQTTSGIGHRVK